ncbi:hypothetical protein V1511DRAFT_500639 [Dipodascopsis uninucleata]
MKTNCNESSQTDHSIESGSSNKRSRHHKSRPYLKKANKQYDTAPRFFKNVTVPQIYSLNMDRTLSVLNIPLDMHPEELYTLFSKTGLVISTFIPQIDCGSAKRYGEVIMGSWRHCKQAINKLHDISVRGFKMEIYLKQPNIKYPLGLPVNEHAPLWPLSEGQYSAFWTSRVHAVGHYSYSAPSCPIDQPYAVSYPIYWNPEDEMHSYFIKNLANEQTMHVRDRRYFSRDEYIEGIPDFQIGNDSEHYDEYAYNDASSCCLTSDDISVIVSGEDEYDKSDITKDNIDDDDLSSTGTIQYSKLHIPTSSSSYITRECVVSESTEAIDPCSLSVRNLDDDIITCKEDLNVLFSVHGTIRQSSLETFPNSGISKGFGFVVFMSSESAIRARDALDGIVIGKKRLVVSFAENRTIEDLTYTGVSMTNDAISSPEDQFPSSSTSPHASSGWESSSIEHDAEHDLSGFGKMKI